MYLRNKYKAQCHSLPDTSDGEVPVGREHDRVGLEHPRGYVPDAVWELQDDGVETLGPLTLSHIPVVQTHAVQTLALPTQQPHDEAIGRRPQ